MACPILEDEYEINVHPAIETNQSIESEPLSEQSIETRAVTGQSSANARTTTEPEARGQSSSNTAILAELKRMNATFHSELKAVSNRVDTIAELVYGPPAKKRSRTAESPRSNHALSWATGLTPDWTLSCLTSKTRMMLTVRVSVQGTCSCQRTARCW